MNKIILPPKKRIMIYKKWINYKNDVYNIIKNKLPSLNKRQIFQILSRSWSKYKKNYFDVNNYDYREFMVYNKERDYINSLEEEKVDYLEEEYKDEEDNKRKIAKYIDNIEKNLIKLKELI